MFSVNSRGHPSEPRKNKTGITWLEDLVLILGGFVAVVVLDELGKKALSLYLISYLILPAISLYLVNKYGKRYKFEHLQIWKGAAIFVSYLILPILYWRVWQEEKSGNTFGVGDVRK